MIHLTRCMALALAPEIRVNSVAPASSTALARRRLRGAQGADRRQQPTQEPRPHREHRHHRRRMPAQRLDDRPDHPGRSGLAAIAVKLTPREQDRLTYLHDGRAGPPPRGRGIKLNHPEAVALICDEILEEAAPGAPTEVLELAGRVLERTGEVMEGIPEMIPFIQIDALFPDGSKLVLSTSRSDRRKQRRARSPNDPGEIIPADEPVPCRGGRRPSSASATPRSGRSTSARTSISSRRTAGCGSTARPPSGCAWTFRPAPRSAGSPARRRRSAWWSTPARARSTVSTDSSTARSRPKPSKPRWPREGARLPGDRLSRATVLAEARGGLGERYAPGRVSPLAPWRSARSTAPRRRPAAP